MLQPPRQQINLDGDRRPIITPVYDMKFKSSKVQGLTRYVSTVSLDESG